MTMWCNHICNGDQAGVLASLSAPISKADLPTRQNVTFGGERGVSQSANENRCGDKGYLKRSPSDSNRQKVTAAGIEPSNDFDATNTCICDRENCQQFCAANALHFECFKRHLLASLNADLRQLIDTCDQLTDRARNWSPL
jgi:hypothetical protein